MLEQEHNGLGWRTVQRADTDASGSLDEERTFAYSADWRLLEERVDSSYVSSPGLNKRVQHVWGKRYIDDAVSLRADLNNDGDYADSNEGTWYHVTDAMFSSVALVAASNGALVERVTYDAYGHARHHFPGDVDADGDVDSTDRSVVNGVLNKAIDQSGYRAECDIDRDGTVTTSDRTIASTSKSALAAGLISVASAGGPDNAVGWDSYVSHAGTGSYSAGYRTYAALLGRWPERDPIGNAASQSLYEYAAGSPLSYVDPSGMSCTDCNAMRDTFRSVASGGFRMVFPGDQPWMRDKFKEVYEGIEDFESVDEILESLQFLYEGKRLLEEPKKLHHLLELIYQKVSDQTKDGLTEPFDDNRYQLIKHFLDSRTANAWSFWIRITYEECEWCDAWPNYHLKTPIVASCGNQSPFPGDWKPHEVWYPCRASGGKDTWIYPEEFDRTTLDRCQSDALKGDPRRRYSVPTNPPLPPYYERERE